MPRRERADTWTTAVNVFGRPLKTPPSPAEVVFENAPQCSDAILPTDLLALLVGSTSVRDSYLIDAGPQPGDLRSDLRLEPESIFFNHNLLNEVAAEEFVAYLHVSEIEVREHVGEERQELVPHGVPEIQDPV